MGTIINFMSADHQACDDKFALAEQAVYANNWPEAQTAFELFRDDMVRHFRREEEILFPALLNAGGPGGPVQVMKMEHAQLNSLLENMTAKVKNRDAQSYSGLAETLLILLQQHNLKEEQILYPIAERLLERESEALRNHMQSLQ